MNLKKIFLLLILTLLLIGVSYAAEVSDDTLSIADSVDEVSQCSNMPIKEVNNLNDEISTKELKQDNTLKEDTSKTFDINDFDTLHNALTTETYDTVNINIKTNITLENNTYVNEAIKTLNINGNNNTINGNNTYQFIKITSGTITINNIQIINCFNLNGGAIYNSGNLTITNSTLYNNKAIISYDDDYYEDSDVYGGAIYNCGTLIILNSILNSNVVDCTEGNHGYGGAIYSIGNLTITDSILNNNYAPNDEYIWGSGGAILSKGNINITNTTFNHNSAVSYGALSADGNVTIINSTFNRNQALLGNSVLGASGNVTIINITLNNYFDIYSDIDNYIGLTTYRNVTIINSTLNNSRVNNDGNLTITNSTLTNNSSIHNTGNLIITHSTLNNNTVGFGGGAIYNYGNLTITNSTLNNNTAKYGGAIYNYGNLTITNSTLNNNTAENGGAIYNYGANTNTLNSSYKKDKNGVRFFYKEEITSLSKNNLIIINSTLYNNKAEYDGGAISNYNNIIITNSTFNNNTAGNGGAIYNKANLTVINSILNDNTATNGGGICNDDNTTIFTDTYTEFESGITTNYVTITHYTTDLSMKNSTLQNNTATIGGAIYNYANNTIIDNNIFVANNANTTGKVIINHGKATISNNTNVETSKYSGTVYTNGTNVTIENNIFYDDVNVFINSMNVINAKYVLTTKITDLNYTKLNNGRVSYTLDGKWIGSINVINGSSWISFKVPTTGNHTLIANYIDTNGIQLGSDTFTFEKKAKVNVLFNAYNVKNDKVIIVSTVKDENGNNITDGRLSYNLNGKWIGSIAVKNGSSWISYNYTNNTVTFKATYITNNNITQTSYTRILNLTKLNNLKNQTSTTQEDKTLKNSSVHILINSMNLLNGKYVFTTKVTDDKYVKLSVGRVSYTLDGKWIGSVNVTNGSSWISFSVPVVGNHTVVATYIDTNGTKITTDTYTFEKKPSTSGVNSLFNQYDVKNGKVVIVTAVKNDTGNPINSGRISYSVNGKWIGSVDVKNGSSWISFNYTNTTVSFKATFITNSGVTENIYTRTLDLDEIARLKQA